MDSLSFSSGGKKNVNHQSFGCRNNSSPVIYDQSEQFPHPVHLHSYTGGKITDQQAGIKKQAVQDGTSQLEQLSTTGAFQQGFGEAQRKRNRDKRWQNKGKSGLAEEFKTH